MLHTSPRLRVSLFGVCLLLLLVACGSDDDDGGNDDDFAPITVNLSDVWRGQWRSTTNPADGAIAVRLRQSGTQLTGDAILEGSPCFRNLTLTGEVDGRDFAAQVVTGTTVRIDFVGRVAENERALSGTYDTVRGGQCAGDQGTFHLVRQED